MALATALATPSASGSAALPCSRASAWIPGTPGRRSCPTCARYAGAGRGQVRVAWCRPEAPSSRCRRGGQLLLHVRLRPGRDQRGHHPRGGHHVGRAPAARIPLAEPGQRVRQFTVPGLGRGPADQRHVTGVADLIEPLGQLADEVGGGLAGQHGALLRLADPEQAERHDGRVAHAPPGRPQRPAAARGGLAGGGEHELAVYVLLGQAAQRQQEQHVSSRVAPLGVTVGDEAEPCRRPGSPPPCRLGGRGRAAGSGAVRPAMIPMQPSLHDWPHPAPRRFRHASAAQRPPGGVGAPKEHEETIRKTPTP